MFRLIPIVCLLFSFLSAQESTDILELLDQEKTLPPLRFVLDPLHRNIYFPQVQVIAPVTLLSVQEGDSFKKGDLILQLDSAKFQAFYEKTKASVEKARIELRSKEKLYQDHTISFFDYMEAKSNLATALAEEVIAKKNLEATSIYAPYDGKVALLNIELHELPVEAKVMMEIIEDDQLVGKMLVPSRIGLKLKPGDSVDLFIDDIEDTIKAKVTRIGAQIDPASGTIKIEVNVDNSNGNLKAGMSGTIEFEQIKQSQP